jgi:hypothetical protein
MIDSSRAKVWALHFAGVALLVLGLVANRSRVYGQPYEGGVDFAVLHVMGVGILRGVDVYQLNRPSETRENVAGVAYPPGAMGVVVYPPVTGFPMLPLAWIPYRAAKLVWFVLLNATLILGIRVLVRVIAPRARSYVWMLCAGVVLLSAAIRWGMMLLQGAPLVLGLMCFFVAALVEERSGWSLAIAAFVTAFKVTLSLPFLGLLLLRRRFAAVAASGAIWIALNVAGFARMGRAALPAYQASVSAFESVDDLTNINSPDPWRLVSVPRLDWVSLFYGASGNLSLARAASLACAAAVSLWLLREGLRAREPASLPATLLFLAPLVCLGSLAVYHHQYDLCLFFAPVLLALFGFREVRKPAWALALTLPLVAMMLLLPIGAAQQVVLSTMGTSGVGLLKLSFPVAITLALAGSMALLRHNLRVKSKRPALVDALVDPPLP